MPEPVLYLIQHRDYSGAETSQQAVISADPDALVACPPDSPTERFARGLGAATTPIRFRSLRHSGGRMETVRSVFRGIAGVSELRRVLGRHPERRLIYAVGIRSGLLASLAAGRRHRVVWSLTDRLPPRPLRPAVRLVAWARAERVICLSRYIAADFVGGSKRLRKRTDVVNPGVDPERFRPLGSAGAPAAAIVGHISDVKRVDLAIEVAIRVARRETGFRLRIVGGTQFNEESEALQRRLRDEVASNPIARETVEFVGRQRDVAAALEGSGLLLHCRPDEPFGMVLIEAMALGLPVVAPAAGGPLEIVEDGVTGLLFAPGDPSAAAACVLRLLADPALTQKMGAAARERVEARFTAARQLELTRSLLGSTPGGVSEAP